jgi:hypothetical protein
MYVVVNNIGILSSSNMWVHVANRPRSGVSLASVIASEATGRRQQNRANARSIEMSFLSINSPYRISSASTAYLLRATAWFT